MLRLTGTTAAHRQSAVAVSGMGMLKQLLVREGDVVKAGQVIARLDSAGSSLQLKQAEAALAMAKVQLEAAEREHQRLENLAKDKAVAGVQLDQAATGHKAAQAGVNQAQALINMARKAVADTVVRAP
ncbi:MAG: biotin/lipoyl-binding protein, partial [Deltaproteobacteria bacterium]|nr:biotin/lipoyl-binding protein [Deltaproteobacteria bacterium]